MRIFLTLFLISLIVISKAQIYTQFDAGYNFPIYEKNDLWTDTKIFDNDKFTVYHRESVDFSVFSGYNITLKAGYILKNKIQFELGFSYFNNYKFPVSDNNKISYDSTGTIMNYLNYKRQESFSSKYYSINPNIAYITGFEKLKVSFLLGLNIRNITIYSDSIAEITADNEDWGIWPSKSTNDEYKYYTLVNYTYRPDINIILYSGVDVFYQFSDRISTHLTLHLPLYSSKLVLQNTKTRTYYKHEEYKNNELVSSEEKTEEEQLDNPDNFSFNTKTINFSFGIRYTFKKKKTE